jgi:hypothetical protein
VNQQLPPPQELVVENQERASISIHDPLRGTPCEVPVKTDAIILNPNTGERIFHTTTSLQRTLDGRLVMPDQLHVCRECGKGPYSPAGIAYCVDCQRVIGKHCCVKNQALPLCKRHRWWRFMKALMQL